MDLDYREVILVQKVVRVVEHRLSGCGSGSAGSNTVARWPKAKVMMGRFTFCRHHDPAPLGKTYLWPSILSPLKVTSTAAPESARTASQSGSTPPNTITSAKSFIATEKETF